LDVKVEWTKTIKVSRVFTAGRMPPLPSRAK
jgi:hypothetical protein